MFKENFSFESSASVSARFGNNEYTTTDISPLASRSPSPSPRSHHAQRTASFQYQRDDRYDTYRAPRHPSVTALTAQLEIHTLASDYHLTPPITRGSISSGTDIETDIADEGFFESDTPPSEYDADLDHSLFDLSMRDLHATSSPRPSLSLEAQALSAYTQRRRQRQSLVRLQCMVKRAPDLAMLIEECHPSSLPLSSDPLWQAGSRSSRSSSTTSASRVDKDRWASVRKMPRMRQRLMR